MGSTSLSINHRRRSVFIAMRALSVDLRPGFYGFIRLSHIYCSLATRMRIFNINQMCLWRSGANFFSIVSIPDPACVLEGARTYTPCSVVNPIS